MTKREKLLKRTRTNPKNVSFRDIQTLLEAYGFELKRVKGSHHVFSGEVGSQKVRLVIPYGQPFIKEAYIREVLDLIDRIEQGSDVQ